MLERGAVVLAGLLAAGCSPADICYDAAERAVSFEDRSPVELTPRELAEAFPRDVEGSVFYCTVPSEQCHAWFLPGEGPPGTESVGYCGVD